MTSAIRAVTRAHFSPGTGLVPLLLVALVWAAAVVYAPVPYLLLSIWFVVTISIAMGIGLRLHLTSHRAYLVPRLRDSNRILAFCVLFLALLIVTAIGITRPSVPTSSQVLWLWLSGILCLYAAGLGKNPLSLFALGLLVGALFPVSFVRTTIREVLIQGISSPASLGTAVLFLAAALATFIVWRRIGTVRGLTWINTSTGEPTLFGFRQSVSNSLDSMTSRLPDTLWGRAQHFAFTTVTGNRNYYYQLLVWSAIAVFFRLRSPQAFDMLAFSVPMWIPIAGVGVPLVVSQRMFMLPLNRADVLKSWGTAVLISVMRSWVVVALPYGILALTMEHDLARPVSLPFLLATSLVAQLPLFGVTMLAASRKTASGIRYTVFLLPVFLVLSFAGMLRDYPIAIVGIFLVSITLGPILIWLAYRRWRQTEVA